MHFDLDSLSILIPIRNEISLLEDTLPQMVAFFNELVGPGKWAFILVNNNSDDGSEKVIKKYVNSVPNSKYVFERKINYGAAVKAGIAVANTKYVFLIDLDQWDRTFLIWAWSNRDFHDLFIGSRRLDYTISKPSKFRFVLSWGYNSLLQLCFSYTGSDTHGEKLINRAIAGKIIDVVTSERGQFDTELVIRFVRSGGKVAEAPVDFVAKRPPRNLMFSKIFFNIIGLFRLYSILKNIPQTGHVNIRRYSRGDLVSCESKYHGQ